MQHNNKGMGGGAKIVWVNKTLVWETEGTYVGGQQVACVEFNREYCTCHCAHFKLQGKFWNRKIIELILIIQCLYGYLIIVLNPSYEI